ncbi:MAG: DUF5723 family protein [Bacteroidales bacterium]|nr:DUF5723 family protein [Bacteroidales bacterium]
MRKLYMIVFMFVLMGTLSAQVNSTMYFMDRVPQSSTINPAQAPDCKFYMGGLLVPICGQLPPPITLAVNLPIDYNDVIFYGQGNYMDSLITPLHPTANFDDFLKKLSKVNYISTDLQLSLLNFGFKAGKKSFITFDLSEKMFANVGLPRSLFDFAAHGNDVVRTADFTGLGVNAMYYHQLSLGFQKNFSKTFSAGLRAKLLVGVANVRTASSKIVLSTAEKTNYLNVQSEYVVNTNIPLEVSLDDEGYVDGINFTDFSEESIGSIVKNYAVLTGNYGGALDFGFSKNLNSFFSLFASVEDLGFINWKTNTSEFAIYDEDSMKFEGVKISNLNIADFADVINLDSIASNFTEINYKECSYKTYMPTKIYAGIRYRAAKRMTLGALARFEMLPNKLNPSLTFTANFTPFKFTAATLSYSVINNNFDNIGLGFTVHPGCMQWYFVSDNIIGAALFPANTRSISFRMGCNLVFGCVNKHGKRDSHDQNNSTLTNKKKHKNKGMVPYSK